MPRMTVLSPGALILAILCCACGEPPKAETSRQLAVADSAGVRVIGVPGVLDGPSIPITLLWTHGFEPSDYEFTFVMLGTLSPDGAAFVGDMGSSRVVEVSSNGAEYRILAGEGQGPREVRRPRSIVTGPDGSIWVEDPGNGRLIRFAPDSAVSSVGMLADDLRRLMPVGVDQTGDLLMVTGSFSTDFETPWIDGSLVRFDPDAALADTVGSYPMAPRAPEEGVNPFGPYGAVTSGGGRFIYARTDIAELVWRDAEGRMTQVVRWVPDLAYPDDALWSRFVSVMRDDLARMNPRLGGDDLERFLDERVATYELDPSLPVPLFSFIKGGADGSVWLADFAPGDSWASGYRVVSSDGERVGRVEFPGPSLLVAADAGRALVVVRDELGVQGLSLYELGAW